jgi:type I restriction enzyme S subunit
MAAINHVMLSDAVSNNRFSAEFFDPKYVFKPNAETAWFPIGRILKKCEYGISISMNSEGKGFPIFRMNELENCFALRPEKYAEISDKEFEQYRLRPNDVLFNRTNSFDFVGRTGLVKDQTDCTFASYLIRLIPSTDLILPEYLAVYLNTRFGIGQVKRRAMRSINQANVSGSEIRRVLIPVFDKLVQKIVADLVNASFEVSRASEAAYTQAQQLLEAELGLNKLSFQKPVGYTARFSEMASSRRSDAEFFNPELRYFQREIARKHSLPSITEFVSILKFSNPPYGSDGVPIITQKHLGKISPGKYGNDLVAQDSWITANPLAVLRKNDLLYYSVGAYLGKTNLWLSDDRAVHASFITMLRCHDQANAGFLQVLLNSTYGILQSKCFQSGTSQPYIYPKDIRRFLVPDISVSLRQKIHNLVLESYKKAEESKSLLDQAKFRVEQLIKEAVRK